MLQSKLKAPARNSSDPSTTTNPRYQCADAPPTPAACMAALQSALEEWLIPALALHIRQEFAGQSATVGCANRPQSGPDHSKSRRQ